MGETVSVMGYWIPYLSSSLLQGYPPPRHFIQGLESVGLDVDFVNLYSIKKKYGKNEIKIGLEQARSNKIILSYWDYIYNRDLKSVFSDKNKKIIFCVNWNEEPKTNSDKLTILENSAYVTFSQEYYRNKWINELANSGKKYYDKMAIWRFPCTLGTELDKTSCRERIGQLYPNSIIVWGYYGKAKGHDDLLRWVSKMYETSILFCGTPYAPEAQSYLRELSVILGMESRVSFSQPLISEEEANVWFSAADVGVITYWNKIGESSLAFMLGHGKTVITSKLECFPEYANIFDVIVLSDKSEFKDTISRYLTNPNLRKKQEEKAKEYAEKNNWVTSGLLFKNLVESIK